MVVVWLIGWGIEYLIQNGFVVGDNVNVCEENDQKIMRTDIRKNYSLLEENYNLPTYEFTWFKKCIGRHSGYICT